MRTSLDGKVQLQMLQIYN